MRVRGHYTGINKGHFIIDANECYMIGATPLLGETTNCSEKVSMNQT